MTRGWETAEDLLAEARRGLRRLTPAAALDAQRAGAVLVDIRSDAQRAADGHAPGTVCHPRNVLEWRLDPAGEHRDPTVARRDVPVVLVCDEGYQSSLAAATARRFGLDATDVVGGFKAWRAAGLPVTRTIAPVAFTLRNLKADVEDVGSNFDGAPDLEFHMATRALGLARSGLSHQRIPPGYRFPYGHTHREQEEVYVVVRGGGRMKLDDEIVELREWDAVRVAPGTWRGYEAGPEGLELLVIGAPHLGEDPRGDVEGRRDWWDGEA